MTALRELGTILFVAALVFVVAYFAEIAGRMTWVSKRTEQPEPSMHDRLLLAKTRPRAIHHPSGRAPKWYRSNFKRHTHNWSHHFTELNQRRRANKAKGVAA